MWNFRAHELASGRGRQVFVERSGQAVTYGDVLWALQGDAGFRTQLNDHLADSPFPAFRWETPAVTRATASRPFEFVVLDSPGLAPNPDRDAFAEYFAGSPAGGIATFANLGKDAVLVVPCPLGPASDYGHLAVFTRQAPESQRQALWTAVGAAMAERVGARPVWLSTAGAGVSWLHVRLDDRPKYYGHRPYRQFPPYGATA